MGGQYQAMNLIKPTRRHGAITPKTAATSLLAALAFTATGCGEPSSEAQLRDTWTTMNQALSDGDAVTACRLMSAEVKDAIVVVTSLDTLEGLRTCAEGLGQLFAKLNDAERRAFQTTRLVSVRIDGDTAQTVESTAPRGEHSKWVRVDGQWRLSSTAF